jgi:hypothetical protein
MEAVAHNPTFAKKAGVPQSVGQDFSQADKGKSFGKGSGNRADIQSINKPKTNHGDMAIMKKGGKTMANTSRMNRLEELGRVDSEKASTAKGKRNLTAEKKRVVGELKYAKGGMTEAKMGKVATRPGNINGVASKGKTKGTVIKMSGSKPLGMKKGGKAC